MSNGNVNMAMKRLRKDYEEIAAMSKKESESADIIQDDFFDWHFTISGPKDSPYSEGLYHGKLTFPGTFPFAAPQLFFFTPNGRLETNKDICLSITKHHPESWRPSWSVRMLLISIRDHFLIDEKGLVGCMIMSSEERMDLAKKSHSGKCDCGYSAKHILDSKSNY